MKLLDSLYTIVSETANESGHEFELKLNPEHFIYQAHFPGEPITPGVCIMQIAVELFEVALKTPIALNTVKNIKFLRIISPNEVTDVKYSLQKITKEDGLLKVQVTVSAAEEIYAKLSLICNEI
jgi:3-hydroxyacyl-[acyl-carrier-protein] dehydratase